MELTITIKRKSVYSDMRVTSHAEVALIPEARERYLAETGTEKQELIHQCITDAFTDAKSMLRRFDSVADIFGGTYVAQSVDDSFDPASNLTVNLNVTMRKAVGLAETLADALHKYIVDVALAKFYRSVSHTALAENHERSLPADASVIHRLLHTKHEPIYS